MKTLQLNGASKAAIGAVAVAALWMLYATSRLAGGGAGATPPAPDAGLALPTASTTPVRNVSVSTTVDANPFSPTRARPDQRYLLPGEIDPDEVRARRTTTPVRVLGTVISVDSSASFVMAQIGSGQASVVRIGGQIGDFTLRRVTRTAATFVDTTGETVLVPVETPAPAATVAPPGPPGGGRGGRGGAPGAAGGRGGRTFGGPGGAAGPQ